mmetsp:Transcript_26887/g.63068  ORF Transcript_26887/g.63068 Transcript_26887/m.63068 type:complete len:258 (-) Transcript_26887:1043-1816(-)
MEKHSKDSLRLTAALLQRPLDLVHLGRQLLQICPNRHGIHCPGIAFASEDAIYELVQRHLAITIINDVEEHGSFLHIKVEDVEVSRDLWVGEQLIEPLFANRAITTLINGLEDSLQLLHVFGLLVHSVHHQLLGVILSGVERIFQKSRRYHSDDGEDHKRDIQQEKENVRVAHFLHHRPCVSRPVPCEGHLIQCIKRTVRGAIPRPDPQSIIGVCLLVLYEDEEKVPHHQSTHRHEHGQQDHGPAQRRQKALASLHQ